MGCVSSKASVISSDSFRASYTSSPEVSSVHQRARTPRCGELQGPQVSRLMPYQQALVGVARWPDPHFNRDDAPHQMEYGESFYHKSRELGASVANGEIETFQELWSEARDWRASRAGQDARLFSSSRDPNSSRAFVTPITGPYEFLKDRFANRKDGEKHKMLDFLPHSNTFRFHGKIDGERLPLTWISISSDRHADRTKDPYQRLRNQGMNDVGEPNVMLHTQAEYVPKIMQHVEHLYKAATDAALSDANALKKLAEIHWWTVQAVPDFRGSAAKAELCVRSIAQARGMDLPPMRLGIVPDLEALTMPLKDFVKSYQGFFENN
ncbi:MULTISPECIES: XopAH/AvrB family type III secretion system effector [Pseudomonas]|nr:MULTISPECIES: XopAH/AvrB family type III secretion system effector [Pseudomonas]POD52201.1 type III effector [Pseudomonas syringae pv. syringae]ALU59468.1 type III effector Avirulence protein [Pseudomonas syringae pv. lapsa]EKG39909.1 type III effector AvrB3 [Pseudomonas syringae pv. avellanae str. ISPaVe037]EKG42619.1 type III effector protein AvrB3 [Pseudomonas syringae pv. avellanae str. ISPaVe013]MBS7423881.1 type III effector [Pseudomonas syringae]